jgi:CheY-like chemotaxis protein
MVVNDKMELRSIITDYLRADGYSSLTFSENGVSALKRASADPPDMILADYDLPGLNGLELLKAVRQNPRLHDVLFVLISSETIQKYVAQAVEHKVNAYVVKPFTHQTLADKINHVLQQKINPAEGRRFYEDGNRLAENGDLSEALAKYQEALTATEKAMAAIHYKIGQVQERLDHEDQAETNYHEAVGLSKWYVDAYDALGSIKIRQEKYEEARDYLTTSSGISPLNAQRQAKLGEALMETGEFEAAEKAFKMALQLDPTKTHLFNRLGINLRRQGKFDEARQYFEQALDVSREDENLFYNLSRVVLDQGDETSAARYLAEALKIKPDFTEAHDLLETIRSNRKKVS